MGHERTCGFGRSGWEKTVARMVTKGAELGPEERKTVIDHLVGR